MITQSITSSRLINRTPFFYGWVVMMAGTLGLIMTSPGQTFAVSIFIEQFISDLGISRSLVSTLYTVGTLTGSFALPFIGRQIDWRGPRRMVVIISLLFGLACIYMGYVQNAIMLGLGFILIRMLGQGSLSVVSQHVINQWWVRRRGAVLGISNLLLAILGLGTFPSLINWLIPQFGWRGTYMVLGGLLLLVMVPVGHFLFRDNPEQFGLQPDGGLPALSPSPTPNLPPKPLEENWPYAEAVRTRAFRIVALGLASIAMFTTGLLFHIVSIFADNNLPTGIAAAVFLPISITTAIITLASGILVDRLPVRYLLAASLLMQAAALLMAPWLSSEWLALLYGGVLGLVLGLSRTVGTVVWANYFGRRYLGAIAGTAATIGVAGSALGPMPFGIARDLLGNYNLVLMISAAIPLGLGFASLLLRPPHRPANPEQATTE